MNQTVREALQEASSFLQDSGLKTPRLEAEVLLCFVMKAGKVFLYSYPEHRLKQSEVKTFWELIARRCRGYPSAYLTGTREFMGLPLLVNPAVLIPRPETELLVEAVLSAVPPLQSLYPAGQNLQILDIGTGSGAIAVSLLVYLPQIYLAAVELDPQAIRVAAENARRYKVASRLKLFCGDLFAPLPPEARFQIMVSNPPYVVQRELPRLPVEVRQEPLLALDGGADGLSFYRRILNEGLSFLQKPGLLALEVGSGQAERVKELCRSTGQFYRIESRLDYAGHPRVVLAHR